MLPAGDAAEHPATRLDSTVVTQSVAVAMQTRRDELAANQPIELRLRLDPPELGIVRVHLRLMDEAISVRFITGDEAVTRMLESQLPDLRQSLAERGLAFAPCDVMYDSRQQQSSGFGFDSNLETPIVAAPRAWSQPSSSSREKISHNNRIDI